MSDRTNKARVLSLKGRGQRLKAENLFLADELMPLLGDLDRALTLEGKLEGSSQPFPSPLGSCQSEACCRCRWASEQLEPRNRVLRGDGEEQGVLSSDVLL